MKMRNLRVAYFSDLDFPSNTVATKQILKTIDSLQQLDMNVELFIAVPWKRFSTGSVQRIKNIREYYGVSEQLRIVEFKPPLPMIKRLHRPIFSYRSLHKISKKGFDLVCVRNILHLRIAISLGLNVLFETYKYFTSERTGRSLIRLLNENKNFVGVIVHSELTRNHWLSLGAKPEKIKTIHNGFDALEFAQPIPRVTARQMLKLSPDLKIICYTGNIDKAKGMDVLLQTAHYLPEFHFMIVGGKNKKDIQRLEQYASRHDIRNFTVVPWQPPSKIVPYLFSADALIIPPTRKPLMEGGKTVLPIKTFTYLASGIPILAPRNEDTSEILFHKDNAFLLTPDAPQTAAAEIRSLFQDNTLINRIRSRAIETSRSFTWENRAKKIISFIEERWTETAK